MKRNSSLIFALLTFIIFTVTSCQAIADIFKAGVWTGTIIVVLILALVIWLIFKFSSRNKS